MIIFSKKKKIQKYLESISVENRTPFEQLLQDYLSGDLKNKLNNIGINKISIHIDWLDDYKCMGIQAKYNEYYMDCQIFENEFTLAFDLDEADDDAEYLLKDREYFYSIISKAIETIAR